MIPLTLANSGASLDIKKVMGKSDIKRHLETLGVVVGERITVISKLAGNIIVNVRGTRIALDQTIAAYIMVSVEEKTS